MALIPVLVAFANSTPALASEVNSNFSEIRTAFNNTAMLTDTARTVAVQHTFAAGFLSTLVDSPSGGDLTFGSQELGPFIALSSLGHLYPITDNTYNLGDGTHRFRTLYLSSGAEIAGTVSSPAGIDLRLGSQGTTAFLGINSSGHVYGVTDAASDLGVSGNRFRDLVLSRAITHGDTKLLATTTALANGAAAAAGTLTNAPAAGNPTKWIPIVDNGTTRYVPAW